MSSPTPIRQACFSEPQLHLSLETAERSRGHFIFLIGMLGLLGYSTRLLWKASHLQDTIRPKYQSDLFWARCTNAIMYSTLALVVLYAMSLRSQY